MADQAGSFPIVAVGASAGGVEALEAFFGAMPDDPGCGFVLITHLDPKRRSLLPEIIARFTAMPVHVAEQGALVGPNEVHVMPADALLEIRQGRLEVRKLDGAPRRERNPIDIFFNALAEDQGEYAVGVVLSGGDGDGTLGVRAINERGGLTLAQVANGHPPQHPEMPQSAIATGLVDLAIPVAEMGARLSDYAHSQNQLERMTATGRGAGVRDLGKAREQICAILRSQIGHDFSGYKERTFLRRVQRRLKVHQLDRLDDYLKLLRRDPDEVTALFRDLLISVTSFFRDPGAFDALETEVIPRLFAGRGADDTVRVWIPGCATGEEAFSIAILLREHLERSTAAPRVQIFATDIDEAALATARSGRFPAALLGGGGTVADPSRALLHSPGRRLSADQGGARAVHLLVPQRHPRPAILTA